MKTKTEKSIINVYLNGEMIQKQQKDYTLADLRQKLINDMYEKQIYSTEDAEILKTVFYYERSKPTNRQNSAYATRESVQCLKKD